MATEQQASSVDNVESTGVQSGGAPQGSDSWSRVTIVNHAAANLIIEGHHVEDGTLSQAPPPAIAPGNSGVMRVEGSFWGRSQGWVAYTIAGKQTHVKIDFECPTSANNNVSAVPLQNVTISPFSLSGHLDVTVTINDSPSAAST